MDEIYQYNILWLDKRFIYWDAHERQRDGDCLCHPKNVQKHVDGYAVYVFTLLESLDCIRENRSMMMAVVIQMQPKSFVSTDPVCTSPSTNDKALHSPIYAI